MGSCISSQQIPIETRLKTITYDSISRDTSSLSSEEEDHPNVIWQSSNKSPTCKPKRGVQAIQYRKSIKQVFHLNINSPDAVQIGNKNSFQKRLKPHQRSMSPEALNAQDNDKNLSVNNAINENDKIQDSSSVESCEEQSWSVSDRKTEQNKNIEKVRCIQKKFCIDLDNRTKLLTSMLDELSSQEFTEPERRQKLRELKVNLQDDFDKILNKIETNINFEDKFKHLCKQNDKSSRAINEYTDI